MPIDEAIKTNEEHAKTHRMDTFPDYYKALVLGIEALKRFQLWRECGDEVDISPLPGETEETKND